MTEKKDVGRPPYQPTDENRTTVCDMVACGLSHDVIAKCLKISDETLRKYYQEELDTAKGLAIKAIGKCLMQKALDGDGPSQMFYLKTQGRWREKDPEDDKPKSETELYALRKI
jgi:hypothetical protein